MRTRNRQRNRTREYAVNRIVEVGDRWDGLKLFGSALRLMTFIAGLFLLVAMIMELGGAQ